MEKPEQSKHGTRAWISSFTMFVVTQLEDWIKIYKSSVFLLLQATFHYKDLQVTNLYSLHRDEFMLCHC